MVVVGALSMVLIGCGAKEFDAKKEISVVSREEGSGTRGAFIELFEVEEKDSDVKKDRTTKEAIITKQSDIMLTSVHQDFYSIGYVSTGSLNENVKAIPIEGVEATAENIKNGTYEIARPFQIATKGEAQGVAKDFIEFILSAEGQSVVSESYIAVVENAAPYAGDKPSGKIVVGGSSSVTPVMEKLKEAYLAINPNAKIEIQQSDSSAGLAGVIEESYDIGMASRDLKEGELKYLTPTQIALDGIAVIANTKNPVSNLSKTQVKDIFTGTLTNWGDVIDE